MQDSERPCPWEARGEPAVATHEEHGPAGSTLGRSPNGSELHSLLGFPQPGSCKTLWKECLLLDLELKDWSGGVSHHECNVIESEGLVLLPPRGCPGGLELCELAGRAPLAE